MADVKVVPVQRWMAECDEDDCTWRQLHTSQENAVRDAERHAFEWHGQEP